MMIKRVFLAVDIFLVAVLIVMGICTVRSLSGVATQRQLEIGDFIPASIIKHPAKPLSHYSIIGERKLFGARPSSPDIDEARLEEETARPIEALPRTELRLRLKGTICGSSPSFSYAVIEDLSSKKEELYRLGDMVAGVKIVRIERNQVVIERGGVEEVLASYEEGMLAWGGKGKASPVSQTAQTSASRQMVLGEKEMAGATEAASRIVKSLQLDPQNLPGIFPDLTEAVSVANQVLNRAKIKPYFVDGHLEGFQAMEIQAGSIYERMGLHRGDIVREVNGYQINSIQNAFQVYEMLQKESVVIVNVERDGQPVTLIYEIKGLKGSFK